MALDALEVRSITLEDRMDSSGHVMQRGPSVKPQLYVRLLRWCTACIQGLEPLLSPVTIHFRLGLGRG